MAATKLNYIAKLNGEIVGTRSSNRTYTHAVVIQYDEQWHRERAHSTAHAASWATRNNFDYYSATANHGVEGERAEYKHTPLQEIEERVAHATAIRDMGYDAWVEQKRQENIASHEDSVARGGFKPCVLCWNGRRDLAEKEAAKRHGERAITNVWIVDAETVAKLPKIKGERKHAAYGPHSH